MARIEKLDIPTRVKLRSSQILTSLPQIVTELVQNSIDAGATNIDVGVDCEEWVCWVRDDGAGISRDSLAILASGNEEGRYGSGKCLYSGPAVRWRRDTSGTVVCIRDAFYNVGRVLCSARLQTYKRKIAPRSTTVTSTSDAHYGTNSPRIAAIRPRAN
ncbi:hypothetical protein H0H93_006717 [Arthromyces matolae]|nr:hypothetical protein H0H93_006717 [Arthromyces matolae]